MARSITVTPTKRTAKVEKDAKPEIFNKAECIMIPLTFGDDDIGHGSEFGPVDLGDHANLLISIE